MASKPTEMGTFLACYEIGGDKPGAPLFRVNLVVDVPARTVNGSGRITQAISPPLDIATQLHGQFSYMTVMPRVVHILVVATGYPVVPHGGIGLVEPNADLRMVLDEGWKSGTADYKYRDDGGKWVDIEQAPVKAVPCNTLG